MAPATATSTTSGAVPRRTIDAAVEGLLIAEELERLQAALPVRRRGWSFPDPHTFALPLEQGSLWLWIRPPHPGLALREDTPPAGGRHSGFQDLLRARAVGDLVAAEQTKLDRVVTLSFAAVEGFAPAPPVRLVVELTGRNSNLVLIDEGRIILGVAREVGRRDNRFRQLSAGLKYRPPPPYEKLDPRTAPVGEFAAAMRGRKLSGLRSVIDGIGPQLTKVLAESSGLDPEAEVGDGELDRLIPALRELVAHPAETVKLTLAPPDLEERRQQERRRVARERVEKELRRRIALLERQLGDIDRARQAALQATTLQAEADLLMAYASSALPKAARISLTGFDGVEVEFDLDPRLDVVQNAQVRYDQARKRRGRLAQAESRAPQLRRRLDEAREAVAGLDTLTTGALEARAGALSAAPEIGKARPIGLRFEAPHGFAVLVGRNARENDAITFRMGKSRDVWLHVQGYRGSHVLIQARNREVPFGTILFAASLAAGHSQARNSENVPVDYTLKKNVWKVKGMPLGAVHFSHQRTVYVDPVRNPIASTE